MGRKMVCEQINPHLTQNIRPDLGRQSHPGNQKQTRPGALGGLQRTFSYWETWGFGLSGHLTWLGTGPVLHAQIGPQAIWIWLPGVIVAILLNLQVKRLGEWWPDIAGGTPNYLTKLLKNYRGLGTYVALGYCLAWIAFLPVNAIVLTDLIKANLEPLGITCPETILKISLTAIAFILAFSGSRAVSIVHLFFVIPTMGLLFLFSLQGLGWLIFSPTSPGLLPPPSEPLSFSEWAKWFFWATYTVYPCETASAFVADSRQPSKTLQFLIFAAWVVPPIYLGSSWVIMCLATQPGLDGNAFLTLTVAAQHFWGASASLLVTFLLASSCLLGSATTVANCPRIIYQLAKDGHLSSVFAAVSRRGVFGPALILTLLVSLVCLIWGDVERIVMVTGTGWLACFLTFHLALWIHHRRPEVYLPWLSLGIFLAEAVIFVVGGLAWGWQDWLLGLLFPLSVIALDGAVRHIPIRVFRLEWWVERYQRPNHTTSQRWREGKSQDFLMGQVAVLILLICSAATIGWVFRWKIDANAVNASNDLFVVVLILLAFLGVAIACWTSLPQAISMDEAREQAEYLFEVALDAILVVDLAGILRQANPAAECLFNQASDGLIGRPIGELLPGLADRPVFWPSRSEQTLKVRTNLTGPDRSLKTVEVAISDRANRDRSEYVIILRDITESKHAEVSLRRSEAREREKAQQLEKTLVELKQTQAQLIQTEKMSSLGQLVAGVAHEINNPVNFIHGNLIHLNEYTQNFLALIALYQQGYSRTDPEIQNLEEEMDIDFLTDDLPRLISSMKIGTDRIRQIVLTLRNFSRLDEAQMKPVNIHEGLESSLLILQSRLKDKGTQSAIELIKEYGNLPEVECYAGQLNQVFLNILNNAIDALHHWNASRTPEEIQQQRSTIIIRTQMIDGNRAVISIKDNGPGIPEAVKKQIFDPFFTTKPVGEGTGLGLSISYQIITDKHGGRLECKSQLGSGAEFLIDIPIQQNS